MRSSRARERLRRPIWACSSAVRAVRSRGWVCSDRAGAGVEPRALLDAGEARARRRATSPPSSRAVSRDRAAASRVQLVANGVSEVGAVPAHALGELGDRVAGAVGGRAAGAISEVDQDADGRADEGLDDPLRGGRFAAADGEHEHRGDRDLGQVRAESQQPARDERDRDDSAEAPPGQADDVGEHGGDRHPRGDAEDALPAVGNGLVHGQLHDQQRGQRGEDRLGAGVPAQWRWRRRPPRPATVLAVRRPGVRPRRSSLARAWSIRLRRGAGTVTSCMTNTAVDALPDVTECIQSSAARIVRSARRRTGEDIADRVGRDLGGDVDAAGRAGGVAVALSGWQPVAERLRAERVQRRLRHVAELDRHDPLEPRRHQPAGPDVLLVRPSPTGEQPAHRRWHLPVRGTGRPRCDHRSGVRVRLEGGPHRPVGDGVREHPAARRDTRFVLGRAATSPV